MFVFSVVKSSTPSYQKLQCRLTAPFFIDMHPVACECLAKKENKNRWSPQHVTALARLSSTKQSSSGSVDLCTFSRVEQIRGYVPREMSTTVLIFADGAQIRARICAPVHVYARGIEYAVTPAAADAGRKTEARKSDEKSRGSGRTVSRDFWLPKIALAKNNYCWISVEKMRRCGLQQ